MLRLEKIKKSFGDVEVLHELELSVARGEFVSLLGASGCGKTTLLRIIAGLEAPTSGRVHMGGRDVTDWEPSRRNIAMVFQSYALYPHKTVRENIAFPLRMRAPLASRIPFFGRFTASGRELAVRLQEKVPAVASALDLGGLLERRPAQLSGGQKQRVALARALVRDPGLFLMDEPLSNLDAKLRTEMRREIIGLHRSTGATFVYVTHDQTEAMTMSDRIVLLDKGRIQQMGSPIELYHDPENSFVASFIGTPGIAMLACAADEWGLRLGGTVMRSATARTLAKALGREVREAGIRPEAFRLAETGECDAIPAVIRLVENMGNERLVYTDIENSGERSVCVRVPSDMPLPRKNVFLQPVWKQVFFFDGAGKRVRPACASIHNIEQMPIAV